jgi:hypothetical protein
MSALQFIETIMKQRGMNASKSESSLRKSADFGSSTSGTGNTAILNKSTSSLQLPDINTVNSMSSPAASKRSNNTSKFNSPKVHIHTLVDRCSISFR